MPIADNPYDAVAYPSLIIRHGRPGRLATIARLHGLSPPPIETARMLEVGGGDGLNAIALAAAYPRADFVNIDLAAEPIMRGRAWTQAAGLANVRHEIIDIVDAPAELDGTFDYIVAHGIYAWVPEAVRAGLMALFGRLLSADGVAYVSYNALPGGHTRIALREMILHHVGAIPDPRARIAATRTLLTGFAAPQPRDEPVTAAMRKEAEATLAQSDGQLFHDQLGPVYAPHSLSAVVEAAARHGLRYLGEASDGGQDQGFVDSARGDITDAALVRALQTYDYRHGRYFRKSLFVRSDRPVRRVIDGTRAPGLWASSDATDVGGGRIRIGRSERGVRDPRLRAIVQRLIALRPERVPVTTLSDDPQLLTDLCDLAVAGYVDLHTAPAPFAVVPGPRPRASPLARMQVGAGERRVVTLDHRRVEIDEAVAQALLLSDGAVDRDELERRWAGLHGAARTPLADALDRAAKRALLLA
jgi:hypothetical protein